MNKINYNRIDELINTSQLSVDNGSFAPIYFLKIYDPKKFNDDFYYIKGMKYVDGAKNDVDVQKGYEQVGGLDRYANDLKHVINSKPQDVILTSVPSTERNVQNVVSLLVERLSNRYKFVNGNELIQFDDGSNFKSLDDGDFSKGKIVLIVMDLLDKDLLEKVNELLQSYGFSKILFFAYGKEI